MPSYLTPSRLAEEKQVSRQAVHLAIRSGRLKLLNERPMIIDEESAAAWEPDRERQANGRIRYDA